MHNIKEYMHKFKQYICWLAVPTIAISLPIIATSCACSSSDKEQADDSNLTNVHKWINERTFSIGETDEMESGMGTCWLFYHISDYKYYALTNFHVGFELTNAAYSKRTGKVFYAYQTDDQIGSDKSRFSYDPDTLYNNALPSRLNYFTSFSGGKFDGEDSNTEKFNAVYTEYMTLPTDISADQPSIHIGGLDNLRSFFDLDVIMLDFSDEVVKSQASGGNILVNRLNDLNDYATKNENYVTKFGSIDDYQSLCNKITAGNNASFYTGGFPVAKLNGEDIYLDGTYKYQYQILDGLKWNYFPYQEYTSPFYWLEGYYDNNPINYYTLADHTQYFDNVGITYALDFISHTDDGNKAIGGGASGSMAIYASDENDASTYRAMGIYWGGYYEYDLAFSPFLINYGKEVNLTTYDTKIESTYYPGGANYFDSSSKTFIDYFIDAMNNNKLPLDENMTPSTY